LQDVARHARELELSGDAVLRRLGRLLEE